MSSSNRNTFIPSFPVWVGVFCICKVFLMDWSFYYYKLSSLSIVTTFVFKSISSELTEPPQHSFIYCLPSVLPSFHLQSICVFESAVCLLRWAFVLAVRTPTSHIWVPGFNTQFCLLITVSCCCRTWESAVIVQVTGFLPSTWGTGITS